VSSIERIVLALPATLTLAATAQRYIRIVVTGNTGWPAGPHNWVPLVAQMAAGPASLWVGRDCAKKLFGADASGEATYLR
jgi:hypothetical protein